MPQKSPFLLVSGFHRSGTSLVAQTLHSNGVNLGENLMGASFGNPNGHFEDLSIVELHDELLNLHGLDWQTTYSSTIEPPPLLKTKQQEYAEQRVKQQNSFIGAKDPRALYFFDSWNEAFRGDILFLCVFRGWRYSVSSLLKRHSRFLLNTTGKMASLPKDIIFWLQPNLAAKMWLASAKLILAQYSKRPEKTLLFPLEDLLANSNTFQQAVLSKSLPLSIFDINKSFSPSLLQKQIPASAIQMLCPEIIKECDQLEDELYKAFGSDKNKQSVSLLPTSELSKEILAKLASEKESPKLTPNVKIDLKRYSFDDAIELLKTTDNLPFENFDWFQLLNRDDLSNNNLQALFELAIRHKKFDVAEVAMQRAINNHPAPWRWMNLGDTYLHKKLFNLAQNCYLEARKLAPNNASFLARLADVETLEGNFEAAQQLIDQAIALDDTKPAIKSAQKRLSETLIKAKKVNSAKDGFLPIINDYQQVVDKMTSNKEDGLALDEYLVKSAFVAKNIYTWLYKGLTQLGEKPRSCLLDYLLNHLSEYWTETVLRTEFLPNKTPNNKPIIEDRKIQCEDNARIGVHIHAFYPALVPEILSFVANIPQPIKLVCTCIQENRKVIEQMLPHGSIVKVCENKGRDIAPWLIHAAKLLDDCDVALKLHTKSSDHASALYGWRLQLLWCLAGTKATVEKILEEFRTKPELTIVHPPYHPALKHDINWGENKEIAQKLANELGITLPKEVGNFPAGSMFWYRPTNIDSLLSQDWNSVNFPPEEGQIDGTVMHAIERILGAFNAQQQTIL